MDTGALIVISLLVMVVGLIGTVLPILPGIGLVWFGALIFFIGNGIDTTGVVFFSIITVISLLGLVLSFVLPGQRSYAAGAAWSSVLLGFIGAIIGSFVLPIFGAIPGGIAGVYLGERLRNTGHDSAWAATVATIKGMGWAFLCQFGAGILVIGTFAIWALVAVRTA